MANSEENQLIQAHTLMNQGHIVKALENFENVLAGSSSIADAHLGRAMCLAKLGRLLEAEVQCACGLSKEPQNFHLKEFSEKIRSFKPNLKGDRDIEWGFIKAKISQFAGNQKINAKLLDFGCGQIAELTRFAASLGCHVIAVDMVPLTISIENFPNVHFIQADFLKQKWPAQSFDFIINCSSIEHAGLAGRYGVIEDKPDDDLKIMAQMSNLLKPGGKMLLVIPVGKDEVVGSLHRIYGRERLGKLLQSWEIEESYFWLKNENYKWQQVDFESAMMLDGALCYSIGCMVLCPLPSALNQKILSFDNNPKITSVNPALKLFDEEPKDITAAKQLIKSYHQKRLNDIWGQRNAPVWFDHEIDYHLWPKNLFWIERGVRGRMVMQPGCRVLDLCCGEGYYSDLWYSSIAESIDACDNDKDALSFARCKHANPKINYHYLDVLNNPFPNPKYDVVAWFGAIEHFTEEQIIHLLKKIHDALEQNGILVGSTPMVKKRSQAEKIASNRQHDREFENQQDLEKILKKVFSNVQTSIAVYPERTTCYFTATKSVTNQKYDYVKDCYEKVWKSKLNDEQWIKNDGKGRVEYAANYLRNKSLPSNARLLDIGCGRGTLGLLLENDWELFGVDISQEAVKEATIIYKEARCVDLNWQQLPYPDKFFDVVTVLDVIEHVFDPPFLLREIHRVLKPGGELVLTTPNILYLGHLNKLTRERRFPKTSGDKFPYDGGHIHFLTYKDCFDLLSSAGFQNSKSIDRLKNGEDFELKESSVWISTIKEESSSVKSIPIILVVYNRPEHTLKVLEALRQHNIQNLFIFADGPRNQQDFQKVSEVRQLIRRIDWTTPNIIERTENFGLAQNIVDAVNHVFQKHEKLILLEDDCVPREYFFDFMHTCLEKYENNQQIFGISGYTVQIPDEIRSEYPYDLYFCPRIGSWGWATWKRAWQKRGENILELIETAVNNGIDLNQGGSDIPVALNNILKGNIKDVWTLHWVLSVYLNKGMYIYPTSSHISNIGMDGTGIHCSKTTKYESATCNQKPVNYPNTVFLDEKIMENFRSYYDISPKKIAINPLVKRNKAGKTDMKICYINTADMKGGAQKVARSLKQGLQKRGFKTKMFVKNKMSSDPDVTIITDTFADHKTFYKNKGFLYYDTKSTFRLPSKEEFVTSDIIHYHNLHGDYFNPFALPYLTENKPSVWTLHDMQSMTGHCAYAFECDKWQIGCGNCPHPQSFPPITIDRTAEMWYDKKNIYEKADIELIVPSQWLKNIVQKSILKDKKIHLIYNGIDEHVYRPLDKQIIRRMFKIPSNAVIIGFVAFGGLMDERKGGKYILEAHRYLTAKYPNTFFICIGGTSNRAPTERFLQIPFVLDEEKLVQLYCASDIFLFPTLADNCPLIVLELMGCGVPLVSFDIGGVPELIEHNRTGFIAGYKNTEEFVKMAEHLVLEKNKRERFGKAGNERLLKMFTLDRMIDKHIALYEYLIEQGEKKDYVQSGTKKLTKPTCELKLKPQSEKDDVRKFLERTHKAIGEYNQFVSTNKAIQEIN